MGFGVIEWTAIVLNLEKEEEEKGRGGEENQGNFSVAVGFQAGERKRRRKEEEKKTIQKLIDDNKIHNDEEKQIFAGDIYEQYCYKIFDNDELWNRIQFLQGIKTKKSLYETELLLTIYRETFCEEKDSGSTYVIVSIWC